MWISSVMNINHNKLGNINIVKANQQAPYKLYKKFFKLKNDKILLEELNDIIRKYYPDYSKKEILQLYNELNKYGCTYASIANVIIEQIGHDDTIYKELFGYSLYDKNGNINYNKLSVDIFAYLSKMVELKLHIYEKHEFDNYIQAAKELLNVECKTTISAILALTAEKDSKWLLDGTTKENKLKIRSNYCINKSYFGTYEQLAKELFRIEIPKLSKKGLETILKAKDLSYDFYYEDIPSKFSGLGNVKKINIEKWVDKFFESKGIDLSLEVQDINNHDIEYEEFMNLIIDMKKNGYSIMVSSPLNKEVWIKMDKEWEKTSSDKAGHQMNFEGLDDDGNILACSWGQTCMIPKEFYKHLEFEALKFKTNKLNEINGRKSR